MLLNLWADSEFLTGCFRQPLPIIWSWHMGLNLFVFSAVRIHYTWSIGGVWEWCRSEIGWRGMLARIRLLKGLFLCHTTEFVFIVYIGSGEPCKDISRKLMWADYSFLKDYGELCRIWIELGKIEGKDTTRSHTLSLIAKPVRRVNDCSHRMWWRSELGELEWGGKIKSLQGSFTLTEGGENAVLEIKWHWPRLPTVSTDHTSVCNDFS